MKNVTIYSTPTCHFCHAAKEFFKENNIEFTDYDVSTDTEKRDEMIQKSGQMGVPVIFVGDEMIAGFDEERIKLLLSIA
ncbi:MAG: NrdH-redoxin [Candidatus Vogelbacteria bacterium CG10_big_fil_rev_8_21_14_0_10_45_14]|uniref:NrdH-redoxin n=1 Tax=Candidatus Vogelbacteria bacterium CG10_big_fil_rev_8_21_14_0_10_45_14 TaxID=1975042 RepID=A0A2H0RLD4_9BACT|nr:MAG: NrdH-redoxin [Candidatus Vogelbacteria bacterium CG10_big_fil_rev_8_21_14_0_10_45_14]